MRAPTVNAAWEEAESGRGEGRGENAVRRGKRKGKRGEPAAEQKNQRGGRAGARKKRKLPKGELPLIPFGSESRTVIPRNYARTAEASET